MVCTWYNKLLCSPVLNKSATKELLVQQAGEVPAAKPCGVYAADF